MVKGLSSQNQTLLKGCNPSRVNEPLLIFRSSADFKAVIVGFGTAISGLANGFCFRLHVILRAPLDVILISEYETEDEAKKYVNTIALDILENELLSWLYPMSLCGERSVQKDVLGMV